MMISLPTNPASIAMCKAILRAVIAFAASATTIPRKHGSARTAGTPSWGDKGFFKIAYGDCGIDARMWGVEVPKQVITPTWLEKKLITGIWVTNEERNAAAYVDGIGWRNLSNKNDSVFQAMLSALASAKASKSLCNLRIENGVIEELYVF